jgi:predicted nucleic acid-binding protein
VIAFDTNILIYAELTDDVKGRHLVSRALLRECARLGGIVPLQVLAEFLNVCRRKPILRHAQPAERVGLYLDLFVTPFTEARDMLDANELAQRHKLQFFDALIFTVASRAGAKILLSEDLQNGLSLGELTVLNPFDATNTERITTYLHRG